MNDLAMTLEGRFLKATDLPLGFSKSADVLNIRVEEGILPLPWTSPFDDENRNSALTLVLPRHYAGRLKIETVSGTTGLDALVLSEFDWSSVSGELQSRTGQIQIARMKSVSGKRRLRRDDDRVVRDSNVGRCTRDFARHRKRDQSESRCANRFRSYRHCGAGNVFLSSFDCFIHG